MAEEPTTGDVYALDTCAVADGKLGEMGEPVVFEHEGRDLRLCCGGCRPAFDKAPARYLKEVDAVIVAQQKPVYPLETCLVMGSPLGPKSVDFVSGNRLLRMCCSDYIKAFAKEPAKYLAKLDQVATEKVGKDAIARVGRSLTRRVLTWQWIETTRPLPRPARLQRANGHP